MKRIFFAFALLTACNSDRGVAPVSPVTPTVADSNAYRLLSLSPKGSVLSAGLFLNPVTHTYALNWNDELGTSESGVWSLVGETLGMQKNGGSWTYGTSKNGTITITMPQGAAVWVRQ